jgi:hypothetical protein
MYLYIEDQWFKGSFTKWQIFRNPLGLANTNSNIENFNAIIKRDFTGKRKLKMKTALKKLDEIIFYYLDSDKFIFNVRPLADKNIVGLANRLTKSHFKTVRNKIGYTGRNNTFNLKLDDTRCYKNLSCNCSCFLKYAVCSYAFAYASINNLNYYGKEVEESHSFVQKTKRGRPADNKKIFNEK